MRQGRDLLFLPIGLMWKVELRGTECYLAWRENLKGRLYPMPLT